MTTKLEKLRNALDDNHRELSHKANLISTLEDPSEWAPNGDPIDAGPGATTGINPPRCACQHPIRFVYPIIRERDGKTSQVGSTCIRHFAETSPALFEALKAKETVFLAKIAEEKKAAKEAAALAEVREAFLRYRALRDNLLDANEDRHKRTPYAWNATKRAAKNGHLPSNIKPYNRPSDYLKAIKKYEARAISAATEDNFHGLLAAWREGTLTPTRPATYVAKGLDI